MLAGNLEAERCSKTEVCTTNQKLRMPPFSANTLDTYSSRPPRKLKFQHGMMAWGRMEISLLHHEPETYQCILCELHELEPGVAELT